MRLIEGGNRPILAWVDGVGEIEPEAVEQLISVSKLPFVHHHIAVMPDVHAGKGSTIGSVIPTKRAIVPSAVGVDIGCGMMALRTSLTSHALPDSLTGVRYAIEAAVPHGRTDNGGPNDRGAWGEVPRIDGDEERMLRLFDEIAAKHPKLARNAAPWKHLGTLGTGNHFIELCLDEADHVWIMLHSGSRGPGNRIGSYFIDRAKEECTRWFVTLPDKDLAYLPEGTELFDDYIEAVSWAQYYATLNRERMMRAVVRVVRDELGSFGVIGSAVNCHHNYVEREHHYGADVIVTRKGAVRARSGEMGIIPGSMGAKSFIVRGKGNMESFCSCSHGAGRKMSRTKARATFSAEDHAIATAGVECRKDVSVIDETPGAYNDIDAVMAAQADLVEIVHTLKQVVCVKG